MYWLLFGIDIPAHDKGRLGHVRDATSRPQFGTNRFDPPPPPLLFQSTVSICAHSLKLNLKGGS